MLRQSKTCDNCKEIYFPKYLGKTLKLSRFCSNRCRTAYHRKNLNKCVTKHSVTHSRKQLRVILERALLGHDSSCLINSEPSQKLFERAKEKLNGS